MRSELTAFTISCSLKASPEESSSELLGAQIGAALGEWGVVGDSIRAVDHHILPGVQADMGDGDDWPALRRKVLAADILVLVTPTWLGQHSSVAQRVLERLDAELSETDDQGRPVLFDRVALVGVVGNEDGAHHIVATLFQALNDVGFTIPAQGGVYWNGEAMHTTDYKDLADTPQAVRAATATAAAGAVHLAGLLRGSRYPASAPAT